MKNEAPGVVNWRLPQGLRSGPSLEVGASSLVSDEVGKEGWPPSSSHIGARLEQQE